MVRFADTNGYNEDEHHNIYPYRDYVIGAFNDKLHALRRVRRSSSWPATCCHPDAPATRRLWVQSPEQGQHGKRQSGKEFVAKYAADRVRTTATVWMGATLGCAECHDHKFDPYTSKDFYSFEAFFADVEEDPVPPLGRIAMPPEVVVPPPEVRVKLEELDRRLEELRTQRVRDSCPATGPSRGGPRAVGATPPRSSTAVVTAQPPFILADWTPMRGGGTLDGSGRLRLVSAAPGNDGVQRIARTGGGIFEFLLDIAALRFPESSPNIIEQFNWTLTRPQGGRGIAVTVGRRFGEAINIRATADTSDVRMVELGTPDEFESLRLGVVWDASKRQWSVSYGLNGAAPTTPFPGGPIFDPGGEEPAEGWNESISVITIPIPRPNDLGAGGTSAAPARFEAVIEGHVIRRYDPVDNPPAEVAAIRAVPPAQRSAAQSATLENYYLSVAPELAPWNDEIDRLQVQKIALEGPLPHTLVSVATKPRITRVLNEETGRTRVVRSSSPRYRRFCRRCRRTPPPTGWTWPVGLVSPDNPTTARVLVNRLWKLYFGHGIVRTLDDLGTQGALSQEPRAARLVGIRAHRQRLGRQACDPSDGHVGIRTANPRPNVRS